MKNTFTLLQIFLALTISFHLSAQTLDQSQLSYNAGLSARNLPGYSIMQTFTAGLTGTLVQVDMGVFNNLYGSGTLIIYAGSDTTGTILSSDPVSIACPGGACFANFATAAPVTAGQPYTFRFLPGNDIPDPYGVQEGCPGTYADGQSYIIDPSGIYPTSCDLVFRTWVQLPTGIETGAPENNGCVLYPNPARSGALLTGCKDAQVEVFGIHGECVKSLFSTEDALPLDFSALSPGIYAIRINSRTKSTVIKMIREK